MGKENDGVEPKGQNQSPLLYPSRHKWVSVAVESIQLAVWKIIDFLFKEVSSSSAAAVDETETQCKMGLEVREVAF